MFLSTKHPGDGGLLLSDNSIQSQGWFFLAHPRTSCYGQLLENLPWTAWIPCPDLTLEQGDTFFFPFSDDCTCISTWENRIILNGTMFCTWVFAFANGMFIHVSWTKISCLNLRKPIKGVLRNYKGNVSKTNTKGIGVRIFQKFLIKWIFPLQIHNLEVLEFLYV